MYSAQSPKAAVNQKYSPYKESEKAELNPRLERR